MANTKIENLKLLEKQRENAKDRALKSRDKFAELAYKDYQAPTSMMGDSFLRYGQEQAAERAKLGRKKNWTDDLTEGFSEGLGIAFKTHGQNEKFNRVANYFKEVGDNAAYRLQLAKGEAAFNQDAQPYAQTAMKIINANGDRTSTLNALQNVFSQMKANNSDITGEVVDYSPNTNSVIFRTDKGDQMINLTGFAGEDYAWEMQRAKLLKEAEEFERKEMESKGLRDQIALMNAENYKKQTEFQTNPTTQENLTRTKKQIETNIKYISELQPKIERIDLSINSLGEIRDIIKNEIKNGKITSPAGGGLRGWAARMLGNITGESVTADKVKMLLATEYARASEIVGGGVRSDQDQKDFKETLANLEKNPHAALWMLDKKIEQSKGQAAFYRDQINLYEEDPAANLQAHIPNLAEGQYTPVDYEKKQSNTITQQSINPKPLYNQAPEGYTNIKRLSDGRVKYIPNDKVDQALASGEFELVE